MLPILPFLFAAAFVFLYLGFMWSKKTALDTFVKVILFALFLYAGLLLLEHYGIIIKTK